MSSSPATRTVVTASPGSTETAKSEVALSLKSWNLADKPVSPSLPRALSCARSAHVLGDARLRAEQCLSPLFRRALPAGFGAVDRRDDRVAALVVDRRYGAQEPNDGVARAAMGRRLQDGVLAGGEVEIDERVGHFLAAGLALRVAHAQWLPANRPPYPRADASDP